MANLSDLKSAASSAAASAKEKLSGATGNLTDKFGNDLSRFAAPGGGGLLASYATPFTQNARLVKFQLCEAGQLSERLPAQTVQGTEALSMLYRYEVICQSPETGITRKQLMGLPAQIGILTADGAEVLRCGIVTNAQSLGADGGFARYRLTVEPPMRLLCLSRTSRVFQDISVPDIVKTILDEHLASNPAFGKTFAYRFDLSSKYPPRSYCLQYRESEFDFLSRLLAEEGITYRFEHIGGETDSEEDAQPPRVTFVAFDDPWSLPQASQGEIRFHRAEATESEDSLVQWLSARQIGPGTVSLQSYDYKPASEYAAGQRTRTDQGKESNAIEAPLEDYDNQTLYYGSQAEGLDRYATLRQQAHDRRKKSFHGAGTVRQLKAGEWFQLTEHPDFDPHQPEDAEFVVTGLRFSATNNMPDQQSRAKVGDSEQPYTLELQAQRRGLPLVPDFAHTEHARPTAPGMQTAVVVGPAGEEEVYTDELGRVKIQFHWQRHKEHPGFGANLDERSSCWVRVVYPSAGAGWGHQYIPRIGQEVLVTFLEGDIDRPIIMGLGYNGRHPTPYFSNAGKLPANKALSGIRTKEHYGAQYNELVFDDSTGQTRTKLSSEHGKTQLNQGYLIHPRTQGKGEPRGDGYELRTDRHGALRAAEGLLLTTEAKPLAQGKQLDRENAQSQLDSGRKVMQEHAKTAQGQEADPTEIGPETLDKEGQSAGKADIGHIDHLVEASRAWEAGTNTNKEGGGAQPGKQALLLVSAQDGMGLVTPQECVLIAEKNLDTVTHRDFQQTTGRRWVHNIGAKASLFVHGAEGKTNFKVVTAKGDAQVWVQAGDLETTAEQNVRITANKGVFEATAKEELLISCGGGYIRMAGGNIEIHAPSAVNLKAANYGYSGPASEATKGDSPAPKSCGGGTQTAVQKGGALVAIQAALPLPAILGADIPPFAADIIASAHDTVKNAAAPVTDAANSLAGQAGSALGSVKDMAGNALGSVQGMAGNVQNMAGNVMSSVQGAVGNTLGSVQGMAENAMSSVQGIAGNAMSSVQNMAGNALGSVQGMAGNALGGAGDALKNVTGGLENLTGGAGDALKNTTGGLENLTGGAGDALKNVTGGLENLTGGAGDALKNVTGAADSVVGDASKSLAEALPKDLPGLGKKPGV